MNRLMGEQDEIINQLALMKNQIAAEDHPMIMNNLATTIFNGGEDSSVRQIVESANQQTDQIIRDAHAELLNF